MPLLRVGIPALAGLSVLHGLVPPHPGPLVAIDALNADLGRTLLFGLIFAIPSVILAGPGVRQPRSAATSSCQAPQHVPPSTSWPPPGAGARRSRRATAAGVTGAVRRRRQPGTAARRRPSTGDRAGPGRRRPGSSPTVVTVLLPVVLMLLRAIGELTLDEGSGLR